jgi:hypothetical protein
LEERCLQGLKGYETSWELQAIPLPEILFISRSHTASQERYQVRKEARVMRIYLVHHGKSKWEEDPQRHLKQITDRGIDELQRAADFLRPLKHFAGQRRLRGF